MMICFVYLRNMYEFVEILYNYLSHIFQIVLNMIELIMFCIFLYLLPLSAILMYHKIGDRFLY